MKEPLVVVLMPNYNTEKYLKEAIESVLTQSYSNIKLIILDDKSTDNSWDILQLYSSDKRVIYEQNSKNLGRPKTRNILLKRIPKEAEFYVWMDSDDVLLAKTIQKKVSYFNAHSKVDILGNAIEYVDVDLKTIKVRVYPDDMNLIKENCSFGSPVSQGGLMLRSKVSKEKYDESFDVCQDYELWFRLLQKGYVFSNLQEVLYLYRQFPNQGKQKKLKKTIWNTLRIKRRYLFNSNFISFAAIMRFFGEAVSLLLPKQLILWLFYIKK